MIYLGFLLHIYQPPTQLDQVLAKIVNECYQPLLELIDLREDAYFTINLNWSLTEKFLNKGYNNLIELIKKNLEKKKIEITGTAAYHAILPLIPSIDRSRQILLNYKKNREVLGKFYRPSGIFPPEMAFGHEIIDSIKELGYRWVITEDIPYWCIHQEVPYNYIPIVDELAVFLRSSFWSNRISLEHNIKGEKYQGDEIVSWLIQDLEKWFKGEDGYIILAMDGETFGHHIKGYIENFLVKFLDALKLNQNKIKLLNISNLLKLFPLKDKEIPPGSWSTSPSDFWEGNFFPLWKNKYNRCHQLLWELTELAIQSVKKLEENLDQSLNSCTFWWCAVNPEEISPITISGISMLIDVIRQANPLGLDRALKIKEELTQAFQNNKCY